MRFTQRTRGIVQAIAVVLSLALPLVIAIASADARPGGGGSMGSRGSRNLLGAALHDNGARHGATAQPHHDPARQPRGGRACDRRRRFLQPARHGHARRPCCRLLGAGLLGMLFGGGMFSGLGGFSSILGLILQIGLIIIVVRLAMSWWQRRHATASAYAGPAPGVATGPGAQTSFRNGMGFGLGSRQAAPLEIQPADYEAFERLARGGPGRMVERGRHDLGRLATPEMVSYFRQGPRREQGPQRHQ